MRKKSAKMPEVIFSLAPYDRLVKFQVQIQVALSMHAGMKVQIGSDAAQLYRIICHVLTYNSNEFVFGNFFPILGVPVLYPGNGNTSQYYRAHLGIPSESSWRAHSETVCDAKSFQEKKLFFVPLPPSHVSRLLSIRLLFRDARKRASINPDRTSTSSPAPLPSQSKHCIKKLES